MRKQRATCLLLTQTHTHIRTNQPTGSTLACAAAAGPNAVQRELGRLLGALRNRRAFKNVNGRASAANELRRAALGDAAALPGEEQLRELAALVGSPTRVIADGALLVAFNLLSESDSHARRAQLVRADGMAAAVAARLRIGGDARLAMMAADVVREVALVQEGRAELLARAPGVLEAAAAWFALPAPRAAAELAGFDVDAIAAAAADCGDSASTKPGPAERKQVAYVLLDLVANRQVLLAQQPDALLAAAPPCLVPALVALMAHDDPLFASRASSILLFIVNRELVPRAGRRFFELADRGALRGVEAELQRAEARLRAASVATASEIGTATHPAALIAHTLALLLGVWPKRLGSGAAAAWAAAAPRLDALVAEVARGIDNVPRVFLDDATRAKMGKNVHDARVVLATLLEWQPKARQAAAHAARGDAGSGSSGGGTSRSSNSSSDGSGSSGCGGSDSGASSAGSSGSGSSSDGGGNGVVPLLRRCCAACGRAPADGARLHRCRGCGPLTGVMYCGKACAREHWVRHGHRSVCEPASAQLRELRELRAAVPE